MAQRCIIPGDNSGATWVGLSIGVLRVSLPRPSGFCDNGRCSPDALGVYGRQCCDGACDDVTTQAGAAASPVGDSPLLFTLLSPGLHIAPLSHVLGLAHSL